MRIKGRVSKYVEQPEYKRRRRAIEWCLRFPQLDIDHMKPREFAKLVKEYESVVIYPNRPHVSQDDDARIVFKRYQTMAREFMLKIKGLSPGRPIHDKVPRRVVISCAPDGEIHIGSSGRQGFKVSFTEHIAGLLNGRKFDEAVKSCPHCDLFFPVLTKHKKVFCSRGCAAKYKQRKKREENPERARRRSKLLTQFSRSNKKFPNDARRRKEMMKYIKKNAYNKNEITEKIREFIEMKD